MTRGTHFAIALTVCAALAAPNAFAQMSKSAETKSAQAAKTLQTPKKSAPVTYPATFSVDHLQMTGRKMKPATYKVGTLQMTGRPTKSTYYNIGTLTMTGLAAKPAAYEVGTLLMTGNYSPVKQSSK